MRIEFKGDAISFTGALKAIITKKLNRSLGRLDVKEVIVTLDEDGRDQKLSLKILDWSGELHASAVGESVYSFIDDLTSKSKLLVVRSREKQRDEPRKHH